MDSKMLTLYYLTFPVGHLQQRFKADSNVNTHVNSFTNCEMTDLLKHRSKPPTSTIPCAPNAGVIPSSLNASIHAPYTPGKEVIPIQKLISAHFSISYGYLEILIQLHIFSNISGASIRSFSTSSKPCSSSPSK